MAEALTIQDTSGWTKATGRMRWLVNPGTSTVGPKLQQEFQSVYGSGSSMRQELEWRDVETVVAEVPFQ